VYDTNVTLEI